MSLRSASLTRDVFGRLPALLLSPLLTLGALVGTTVVVRAQIRPPEVTMVSRSGVQAGQSVIVTMTGVNLQEAIEILSDAPGLQAQILSRYDEGEAKVERDPMSTAAPITDRARASRLQVRLSAASRMRPDTYRLRVRTPVGATPIIPFAVGALPEVDEDVVRSAGRARSPSAPDVAKDALVLPVLVNGRISKDGEADTFAIDVPARTHLVAMASATSLQSRLDPVLVLRDAEGRDVARNDDGPDGSRDAVITVLVETAGRYHLEITDATGRGSDRSPYRLAIGALPYITSAFPLGGRQGERVAVALAGANLPAAAPARVRPIDGRRPAPLRTMAVEDVLAPSTGSGSAPRQPGHVLGRRTLAVGQHPEVREQADAGSVTGQIVQWPVTVNGRIEARPAGGSADHYAFDAKAGQRLMLIVTAERAGSPLDSVLEVLDARGQPVPAALLQAVWATSVDLRDHDSRGGAMRMLSTSELRRGDFVLVDREVMRVRELPKSPDEDVSFMAAMGRRFSYFGTSGEGHALGRPIYKVDVHPPGASLGDNGLPTVTLASRNDDGGPFYGKDSVIAFTAPADGRYVARLADTRGLAGPELAYRLTIAPPAPDFTVSLDTPSVNVPAGGRVPVSVSAFRFDGFDGPIEVRIGGLSAGLSASSGTILPGESSVTLVLSAAEAGELQGMPFRVVGTARIDARAAVRTADTSRALPLIAVTRPADVQIADVTPRVVTLAPGERAAVTVSIARGNGFAGRVPVNVRNLPFKATVPNTGLNGILITEQQRERQFVIEADPAAHATEQQLLVTARWEVNSGVSTEQASAPITLRITGPPRASDPQVAQAGLWGLSGAAAASAGSARRPYLPDTTAAVGRAGSPSRPSPRQPLRHANAGAPGLAGSTSAKAPADRSESRPYLPDPAPYLPDAAAAVGRAGSPSRPSASQGVARERPWWGWVFLGRLHPMVVHFPIGLLLIGAVIEGLHVLRRRPVPSEAATYCLAFGAVGAIAAASLGTLNAAHQTFAGESAEIFTWHRLLGWGVVLVSVGAVLVGRLAAQSPKLSLMGAYLTLVLVGSAVVGATGHLGGQLVHGPDYVTGVLPWNQEADDADAAPAFSASVAVPRTPAKTLPPAPPGSDDKTSAELRTPSGRKAPDGPVRGPNAASAAPRVVASATPAPDSRSSARASATAVARGATPSMEMPSAAVTAQPEVVGGVDFTRDVWPLLQSTCVECHGPDKVKARLRMDSVAGLQRGGKSGPLFVSGDPENSLMLRRVLGLDGEDRMPLDKDPLTDAQIDTLRRWVAAGAPMAPAGTGGR